MYPSNSPINGGHNTNILDSHTILDQTTLVEPYTINNPNPDHSLSSFFYQLPSPCNPYEDEAIFLQHLHEFGLLQHHLHQEVVEDTTREDQNKPNTLDFNTKDQMVVIKTKRTSKKDRHSKINTAQGPRDRRMRLSLDVAREFFDLQDLLGFDKASKTVEWLLIKSGEAIKELTRDPMKGSFVSFGANYSASSTSECEVISGTPVRVETEKPSLVSVQKPKKVRGSRKPTFLPRDKEAREKARERARERTKDKRRLADARLLMNPHPNSDLGDVDQEMMFSYDDSSNGVSHEQQFTDYQVYAKQWEAYSA